MNPKSEDRNEPPPTPLQTSKKKNTHVQTFNKFTNPRKNKHLEIGKNNTYLEILCALKALDGENVTLSNLPQGFQRHWLLTQHVIRIKCS